MIIEAYPALSSKVRPTRKEGKNNSNIGLSQLVSDNQDELPKGIVKVRKLPDAALGEFPTKTDKTGVRREKPLRGDAADALGAWFSASKITEGALFRRLHRNDRVGARAITGDHVARMLKRRAGITGDWAGHSLRSGFVTESGRQGVPLGEVMAMTEHRSVGTVMGYFQAGALLSSRVSELLSSSIRTPDPPETNK